jgi:Raf kinase inhibitor-like YbhB/YbcL family protein
MALELHSPAFAQGAEIPKRYSCDGEDVSPPLQWSGAPPNTRSFALLCHDPDAPSGLFQHWAAYDVPREWTGLAEGHGPETLADGFRQAIDDFGRPGYGGPCPPHGHGIHHYHFRLIALQVSHLPVASSAHGAEVARLAQPEVLAETELVGVYSR